ncbi:MAG TPA: helix-turn-helix domain-containing protein [Pyrinomonadaceae bacterium]|jgi:DNA-binding NtrC family response regulator|nr:helix-turn-helix domain-containing protein [Pyrinomonadaceae bacterium]
MSAERIGVINPVAGANRKHLEHNEVAVPVQESIAAVPLKIAEWPLRNRVQRLLDLASSLLRETESLARDKAFTEESNRLQSLNVAEGIDFYGEVQSFETGLIRLALDQTHGHQAQAARLLHIKPTTLNSKIKLYQIEY